MFLNTEEEDSRRENYGSHQFIVDDYGLGYDDHGDLDYADSEESEGDDKKVKADQNSSIQRYLQPMRKATG
jgi:hypothetical protein